MKRAVLLAVLCVSCAKQTHDMDDQPKLRPLQATTLFADGRASQAAPPQTLAASWGAFADATGGSAIAPTPAKADAMAVLQRGRQRYDIDCAPCHGLGGEGDGIVVQRGFPRPPSVHTDRLRAASNDQLETVIRDGYGVMFPYGDRVAPDDRRAIVAYLRALQLAGGAEVSQLAPADRAALQATAP